VSSEESIVASLERLLLGITLTQETAASAVEAVKEANARAAELMEDIAALGIRVSELERTRRNEHSLTVVGRERFRTLDELATVLRAEFADEVQAITQRIDSVHERALRALTDLTGKGAPA
jgi:hypothetical protein